MVDDVQAVHDAASTGDIDKLWDLIEHDMGLLEATHDSDSPLSRAAEHGQVEVARFLLDQGVDVNRRLFQGWTALCAACYAGHLRVAELLLKRGADATQTTSSGSGPLILASEEGHADVVALLIARGCADIDATDAVYRHTALWLASCNGHAGAARGLLDAGADFLRADGRGRSPLLIASRQRHAACVAPLEDCERAYVLTRARRLRDTSLKLADNPSAALEASPTHLAARVGAGAPLARVVGGGGVGGGEGEAVGRKRARRQAERDAKKPRGEASVEEQVVRCVMVGISSELFVEWLELLGR